MHLPVIARQSRPRRPGRALSVLAASLIAVGLGACGSDGSATAAAPAGHTARAPMTGSMGAMRGMLELQPGADGTRSAADGISFSVPAETLRAGRSVDWRFRVLDRRGRAITHFELDSTKLLHLIVVRDDLTRYQHLHPVLAPDGTFSVPLTLPVAGDYRAIADFTTGGRRYALGVPLRAPGPSTPVTLPSPAPTASTDGFRVLIGHGPVVAGHEAPLTFTVLRDGRPVTGLQPYLGNYGHLVALSQGRLAYTHVHPVSTERRAGRIVFDADLPTATSYRLFLQFRVAGVVHTAAFTLRAG